jgi:hypothetical protein
MRSWNEESSWTHAIRKPWVPTNFSPYLFLRILTKVFQFSAILAMRDSRTSISQNSTVQRLTYLTIAYLPMSLMAVSIAVGFWILNLNLLYFRQYFLYQASSALSLQTWVFLGLLGVFSSCLLPPTSRLISLEHSYDYSHVTRSGSWSLRIWYKPKPGHGCPWS